MQEYLEIQSVSTEIYDDFEEVRKSERKSRPCSMPVFSEMHEEVDENGEHRPLIAPAELSHSYVRMADIVRPSVGPTIREGSPVKHRPAPLPHRKSPARSPVESPVGSPLWPITEHVMMMNSEPPRVSRRSGHPRVHRDTTNDSGHPSSSPAGSSSSIASSGVEEDERMMLDSGLMAGGAGSSSDDQHSPNKLGQFRFPPRVGSRLSDSALVDSAVLLAPAATHYARIKGTVVLADGDAKRPQFSTFAKTRRYSVDSQSSSGRGGSSAMSSAENMGLGIGDFCEIEYAKLDPRYLASRESVV